MNMYLKLLLSEAVFSPKCTTYRLAAGLCPDPLAELEHSSRLLLEENLREGKWGESMKTRKGKSSRRGKGEAEGNAFMDPRYALHLTAFHIF